MNNKNRPSKEDIKIIMESKEKGCVVADELGYSQPAISNIRCKYGYKFEHRGGCKRGTIKKPKKEKLKQPVIDEHLLAGIKRDNAVSLLKEHLENPVNAWLMRG